MIMNYFREIPLLRVLFLALVFVVCFGVLGSGVAFAKHEMQNGHEGDPGDGNDIVGGGGGESDVQDPPEFIYGGSKEFVLLLDLDPFSERVIIRPVILDGKFYFEVVVLPTFGGRQ